MSQPRPGTRDRRAMLLEAVRDGSGGIAELAEEFGVSESTIRRDLASLAGAGHVVRTYGGALDTERSPREKDREHAAAKDAIAREAAALVQDGDVVLLDAGTTTGRLARHLAHREGLTVVTNGVTAIRELAGFSGIDLIVLGGRLRHPNEAILGESVLADHSKLDQAPFSYWAPLDREYRLITDEPRVDVTFPQFAQSVILASGSETVGGAAHDG